MDLDAVCIHECDIVGAGGPHWPAPSFRVVALDRPEEPLVSKSATGCWTQILRRINAEIEARRAEGEDLPPPPKTAIAGPEYFGLNQPEVVAALEALDPQRLCGAYWAGKVERAAAVAGMPAPPALPAAATAVDAAAAAAAAAPGGEFPGAPLAAAAPLAPPPFAAVLRAPAAASGGGGGGGKKRKKGKFAAPGQGEMSDEGGHDEEADFYRGSKWSAINRGERYRKRCADAGEAPAPADDADNPLPGLMDPITLEPVQRPAISPYGHVMGMATWRAVLAEQGRCPFTKQPLAAEQLTLLTHNNVARYRDRIIER